jgi:hypothetical protein
MTSSKPRTVPRPFSLHWGDGRIVEEASVDGPYHAPTLQLLEFEDGSTSIRFCYYDREGRFQRSPLIVDQVTLDGLRAALAQTPRLRALLETLVSND